MDNKSIDQLAPGSYGIIKRVEGRGAFRDRLLDMGLTPGTLVALRKAAPMGDPIQLSLRGYELTVRKSDAACVEVAPVSDLSVNPFRLSCDGRCVSCAKAGDCPEKKAEPQK
ncbi:MAG: ferrous iron transport protein A [Clostridiales bacterium]|nr:ferrous iron transport protein A [Clostridiales bacterium]